MQHNSDFLKQLQAYARIARKDNDKVNVYWGTVNGEQSFYLKGWSGATLKSYIHDNGHEGEAVMRYISRYMGNGLTCIIENFN
jgi:hypothetical protein